MILKRLWPAIIWALVVLVLIGLPGSYIPETRFFWKWLPPDKIVHFFMFATLGFLIFNGFIEQYLKSKKRYLYVLFVLLVTFIYGIITEVLQQHVFVGRDGNVYDFLADAAGGFIGFLAFVLYLNKKNKAA